MEPRQITNEELADLPSKWGNSPVSSKYYDCVLRAWEVDAVTFNRMKDDGALYLEINGRFYVA